MSVFISNVKLYLKEMSIKQSYLSLITGIDKNKISRLLAGTQDVTDTDMDKIAHGLGKDVQFFLGKTIIFLQPADYAYNKIAFYAGNPSEKQEKIANQILDFVENIDEVMGAEKRFVNLGGNLWTQSV